MSGIAVIACFQKENVFTCLKNLCHHMYTIYLVMLQGLMKRLLLNVILCFLSPSTDSILQYNITFLGFYPFPTSTENIPSSLILSSLYDSTTNIFIYFIHHNCYNMFTYRY